MSQVAIICLFDVDPAAQSKEALAQDVLETLQEAGLPIKDAHAWNESNSAMNLGAMGSLISTTVGQMGVPPPPRQ